MRIPDRASLEASRPPIDGYQHFEERMAKASFLGNGAGYWDKRAPLICGVTRNNPFVTQTLKRLRVRSTDTVLDLGAGNGALTIPLSRKVKSVTALDSSPVMLKLLRQRMREDGATNIRVVRKDWQEAEIGRDVSVHDVVLASRSLPMGDLRVTLPKLIAAGRRAWFIIWRVADPADLPAMAAVALGRPYQSFPEYPILVGLLYNLGIYADVEVYATHARRRFGSLDEAADEAVRGTPLSGAEKARLKTSLGEMLRRDQTGWFQELAMRWALIWWEA
jgi:SAM-dependent methyltransferase